MISYTDGRRIVERGAPSRFLDASPRWARVEEHEPEVDDLDDENEADDGSREEE